MVTKGLSTYAGLATALAQYLGAVALFLEADDQALALGPLATATATLLAVIAGRMGQAKAAIQNPPAAPRVYADSSTSGLVLGQPQNLSLEIPGGGVIQDGERE